MARESLNVRHIKSKMKKRLFLYISGITVCLIAIGYILPEQLIIPVKGAKTTDWNHQTFWYEPWGKSGVHKGIDIFAKKGTLLLSSTYGIVIYNGKFGRGGKVIAILGPKWKVHYYAHLEWTKVSRGELVRKSQLIGAVGNSGNAKGLRIVNFLLTNIHKYSQRIYMVVKNIFLTKNQ